MENSGDWQIAEVGKSAEREKSFCLATSKNLLEPRKVWEIAGFRRYRKFGYYRGSGDGEKSLSGRNDVGSVAAVRHDVGADTWRANDLENRELGGFRRLEAFGVWKVQEIGKFGSLRKPGE